jgi:hypothetical protein
LETWPSTLRRRNRREADTKAALAT